MINLSNITAELGLDAASTAILLGALTYIWTSFKSTIQEIPQKVLGLFSYSVEVKALAPVGVPLADFLLMLERDPETKILRRPRNFVPASQSSATMTEAKRKAMNSQSSGDNYNNDICMDSGDGSIALGEGVYWMKTSKYGWVRVSISESQVSGSTQTSMYEFIRFTNGAHLTRKVTMFGFPEGTRQRLQQFMSDAVAEYVRMSADARNCFVYTGRSWQPTIELKHNAKPLTAIFSDSDIQGTVTRVEAFLESEDLYKKLCTPFHYGVLLHGPYGTGKTSLVQAIAAALDLRLYVLQFSSISDDSSVSSAISSVPPGSIILFEDVDCSNTAVQSRNIKDFKLESPSMGNGDVPVHERTETKCASPEMGYGLTLSGLLNALDGVFAPTGVVYMFTTNNIDALDKGLLRPGRIDHCMYMGDISRDLQAKMLDHFGCPATLLDSLDEETAPCNVQKVALEHLTISHLQKKLAQQRLGPTGAKGHRNEAGAYPSHRGKTSMRVESDEFFRMEEWVYLSDSKVVELSNNIHEYELTDSVVRIAIDSYDRLRALEYKCCLSSSSDSVMLPQPPTKRFEGECSAEDIKTFINREYSAELHRIAAFAATQSKHWHIRFNALASSFLKELAALDKAN